MTTTRALIIMLLAASCGPPGSTLAPHRTPGGDGLHTVAGAANLHLSFTEHGVDAMRLDPGADGGLQLELEAWGRGDQLKAPGEVIPTEGGCAPTAPRIDDPSCLPRIDYLHDGGLTAWWATHDDGLQQGWLVEREPAGHGPLAFDTVLHGADRLHASERGARFIDADGHPWSVSSLAAWDADGAPLPAHFEALGDRLRVVVEIEGASWPVTVDPLYTTAASTLTGTSSYWFYGINMAPAGDVNGDGYDDLMTVSQDGIFSTGIQYVNVIHGMSSGVYSYPHQTYSSYVAADYLGYDIDRAGDVNGDGYDDIIVGAQGSSATHAGRVYIHHGSSSGAAAVPARTIYGSTSGSAFGGEVVGLGDIDGDGFDDIAVCGGTSSTGLGQLTVFRGSGSGIGSSWYQQISDPTGGGEGWCQTLAAGDFNGDGYGDLAIAAPYEDYSSSMTDSGRIYIHHSTGSYLPSTADSSIRVSSIGQHLGGAMHGGHDVDGDGYDDLIVGPDIHATVTDYALVYYGGSGGLGSSYVSSIPAPTGTRFFGASVALVPDMNGDGFDDAVVGDYGWDSLRGSVWVYHGDAPGLDTSSVHQIEGEDHSDYFGYLFSSGDFDGDGDGDVAISAVSWGDSQGRVYVYLGYDGDDDGDGVLWEDDCDDTDPGVGAALDWYEDADGDGYGDASSTTADCAAPTGWVADDTDCDDSDPSVNPGATEVCDSADTDEDCDGLADDADTSVDRTTWLSWYEDADGDGYGDAASVWRSCRQLTGWVSDDTDCDDTDSSVSPGATEVCDLADVDEDCDGLSDDDDGDTDPSSMGTWYADADADGYGDPASIVNSCEPTADTVANDSDCDDTSALIHPAGQEICDASDSDEDCDGLADDADSSTLSSSMSSWYSDADGDGYGDSTARVRACDPGSGRTADATDCDDTDAAIHPAATEICDASDIDEDCDGVADDADSSVDSATMSTWYADADGDGYGDGSRSFQRCDLAAGSVADATDCDDADAAINPGAAERCDAADTDEDCDGLADDDDPSVASVGMIPWYLDDDGDGYGDAADSSMACDAPSGRVADDSDCDDTRPAINPDATEVCDAADTDEDCDGLADDADSDTHTASMSTWYSDLDGDGYGDPLATSQACDQPAGAVDIGLATDCDDSRADINPDGQEVCDDWDDDEDCDGLADDDDPSVDPGTAATWYADADGDGYGDAGSSAEHCDAGSGEVADATDCDDGEATVYPGATEVFDDGIDQDCDGADATAPTGDDTGAPGDTGDDGDGKDGCSSAAGSPTPLLLLLAPALALIRRRRPR